MAKLSIFHLKAKEDLADWVTDADALLSTRATPQLINDDQGLVTRIVDYVRDLKEHNKNLLDKWIKVKYPCV